MKILISTQQPGTYTLEIQSGHFCGTLSSISKEDMEALGLSIQTALNAKKPTKTIVWNPRSQRHEKINI